MSEPIKLGKRGIRYQVFELIFTDGSVEIGISQKQIDYLKFLASRGGEVQVNYSALRDSMTPEQLGELDELADELRFISKTPIVGFNHLYTHRLTDSGRNVVSFLIAKDKPC